MKNEICKLLGQNIKKLRKLRSFTQETLAEAIGIETRTLSLIETGKSFVSAKTLENLAEVLHVKPADLFEISFENEADNYFENIINGLDMLKNDKAKLKAIDLFIKALI